MPKAPPPFLRPAAPGARPDSAALMRYLSTPPQDPALRAIAAAIAQRSFQTAWTRLQTYVAAHPSDLLAYRMLGQLALNMGRADMAEGIFARLLTVVPDLGAVRFEHAAALFAQGKADATLTALAPLLARDAANPSLRALHAAARAKNGDFAVAADIYAQLVAEHPRHLPGLIAYGQLLRTLRRPDAAIAAFRRATQIAPTFGEAWWNLANLKTGTLNAADIAQLRTALASPNARPEDRFQLRFALARALEEAGDFAAAFGSYRTANAERLALLPPAAGPDVTTRTASAIAATSAATMAAARGHGHPSDAPIFILGLPRSGSTLLEQILAQHPDIEGTHELADLPNIAAEIERDARGALPPEKLAVIGADYLARTARQRKTGRRHFIDKQPANWQHIGLIVRALPNARIIDMRRDPLACGLSLFRQHFASGARFSYAIDSIAAEIAAHDALLAHVTPLHADRIKRIEIETLVEHPEATIRALLAWLGLPFAAACLAFDTSDRPVFTPSSEQVRRPINDDATALLAGYAPYIGDLRAALASSGAAPG